MLGPVDENLPAHCPGPCAFGRSCRYSVDRDTPMTVATSTSGVPSAIIRSACLALAAVSTRGQPPPPAPRPRGGEPGPGALLDQVPLDYVDSSAHASPSPEVVVSAGTSPATASRSTASGPTTGNPRCQPVPRHRRRHRCGHSPPGPPSLAAINPPAFRAVAGPCPVPCPRLRSSANPSAMVAAATSTVLRGSPALSVSTEAARLSSEGDDPAARPAALIPLGTSSALLSTRDRASTG